MAFLAVGRFVSASSVHRLLVRRAETDSHDRANGDQVVLEAAPRLRDKLERPRACRQTSASCSVRIVRSGMIAGPPSVTGGPWHDVPWIMDLVLDVGSPT